MWEVINENRVSIVQPRREGEKRGERKGRGRGGRGREGREREGQSLF
jgi:hypothetical protein